jgi:hypothetical protein
MFNEPEGMCDDVPNAGWTNVFVSIADVQKVINRCTGAIHRTVPDLLVSNGSWAFIAASDVGSGNYNYYTDARLIAAGGDNDGYLDFYMVHFYDWAGTERSPFHNDRSHWGLDKPLVIGEFPAKGTMGLSPTECYNQLYNRGYAGALSWTYTGHDGNGGLPEARPAMQSLREQHPNDIAYDPGGSSGTPQPTSPDVTRGDVNSDGTINIVDALMIAQYYVGLNPSNFNTAAADTTCDGNIDIVDALCVAQYYVGLISVFC